MRGLKAEAAAAKGEAAALADENTRQQQKRAARLHKTTTKRVWSALIQNRCPGGSAFGAQICALTGGSAQIW